MNSAEKPCVFKIVLYIVIMQPVGLDFSFTFTQVFLLCALLLKAQSLKEKELTAVIGPYPNTYNMKSLKLIKVHNTQKMGIKLKK